MRLAELVAVSRAVAASAGRKEKVRHLAAALRRLTPTEAKAGAAFLSGQLPEGRPGVGPAQVRAALATPSSTADGLAVADVAAGLHQLATVGGTGAQRERTRRLAELFGRAGADERAFLVGLLLGEVRQGALEGVLVEALAAAAALPPEEVRRGWMLAGDLPALAEALLTEGAAGLARFHIRPLSPLRPMLAESAQSVESALTALERADFEYKLDGARIQAHKAGDEVRIFTRRLNDVSVAVPELVAAVRDLPVDRAVLDGEALALRPDGRPQPFQTTMRRFGRRAPAPALLHRLPLTGFYFDCLHRDGLDLIDRPLDERVRWLDEVVPPSARMPRLITADPGAAHAFLDQALRLGHEGVMAKSLEAGYAAGRRGAAWLKLKPFFTLDLVVLAAEWGSGRRRGRLSNLHLGARDAAGGFAMVGKTFKGLTDAMLAWQTGHLLALTTDQSDGVVWVRPELVVEVAVGDVQASPRYPAGLALRFARVRRYRPDKAAGEADSLEAVRAIHLRRQVDSGRI